MSSSSARIGVIPTPPAISATRGRRRDTVVNAPSGPSTITRVPGPRPARRPVKSPTDFTVIRRRRPSGAADSENGCASHQRSRVRKRHRKNWPDRARSRPSARPEISTEITPGASSTTRATRRPWNALRASGTTNR
jgi:hypothetical protein